MLIPIFKFAYTMIGCVDFDGRKIWVRFQSDSRSIKSDKEYYCKCLNGDAFYPIKGILILNHTIEHIELVSQEYEEIPAHWTIEKIFQSLGVNISTT